MISCGPPIASLRSTTTELANWITSFGTGTIWILKNSGGTFSPVYHQGDPGTGISGYDLMRPSDRVFAFDYDGTGKLDHLVRHRHDLDIEEQRRDIFARLSSGRSGDR